MTILDDLKADHRELKAEIRAILKSDEGEECSARFSHFRALLAAHSRAEEKVLYRGLEKFQKGKDEALEGTVEHEVADRLVEDLSASGNFEADKWSARCTVLKELLEHHIEEEEDEMFKTARKRFDKKALSEMGKEFKKEKEKYSIPTTNAK